MNSKTRDRLIGGGLLVSEGEVDSDVVLVHQFRYEIAAIVVFAIGVVVHKYIRRSSFSEKESDLFSQPTVETRSASSEEVVHQHQLAADEIVAVLERQLAEQTLVVQGLITEKINLEKDIQLIRRKIEQSDHGLLESTQAPHQQENQASDAIRFEQKVETVDKYLNQEVDRLKSISDELRHLKPQEYSQEFRLQDILAEFRKRPKP